MIFGDQFLQKVSVFQNVCGFSSYHPDDDPDPDDSDDDPDPDHTDADPDADYDHTDDDPDVNPDAHDPDVDPDQLITWLGSPC